MISKRKVILGLSGGVDSSVTAFLLKKSGYEVEAVRFITGGKERSEDKAAVIASILEIPYRVIDRKREFNESVLNYFIFEYTLGRTPNPCIVCNRSFKFRYLLDELKEDNSLIATGHYAATKQFGDKVLICKGKDPNKEQSYFLALISPATLSKTIFPLYGMEKSEIFKIYRREFEGVEVPGESQDLCFLSQGHYSDLILNRLPHLARPGDFILDGKVIGKHKGIIHYTVGQRRGLGLAHTESLYVKSIDVENNTIDVAPKRDIYSKNFSLSNPVFHLPYEELIKLDLSVRVRYRSKEVECRLSHNNGVYSVSTSKDLVITPGQLAVLYHDDMVFGAGWQEISRMEDHS